MKYPKLKGICKTCLGCNRLENPYFTGVTECEYSKQSIQEIKTILGIQEMIKDE